MPVGRGGAAQLVPSLPVPGRRHDVMTRHGTSHLHVKLSSSATSSHHMDTVSLASTTRRHRAGLKREDQARTAETRPTWPAWP